MPSDSAKTINDATGSGLHPGDVDRLATMRDESDTLADFLGRVAGSLPKLFATSHLAAIGEALYPETVEAHDVGPGDALDAGDGVQE